MLFRSGRRAAAMLFGALGLALGGCGTLTGVLHDHSWPSGSSDAAFVLTARLEATSPAGATVNLTGDARGAEAPVHPGVDAAVVAGATLEPGDDPGPLDIAFGVVTVGADASPADMLAAPGSDALMLAEAPSTESRPGPPLDEPAEEYDPWEPFNEKMFEVNRALDRYVIKPVAKGYNSIMPDELKQMISRGFDNIRVVPRVVNSLLQGKWPGAGREVARFLINSVVGIGGLWDMAQQEFGIEKSNEDFGQTLGVWGSGPGPYLILPLLPPLTVRDGIGLAVDSLLDPLAYLLPFIWERLGMKVGDTINDRALNLDLYQGFEEVTVDFYSAVRNAYLQRRLQQIKE